MVTILMVILLIGLAVLLISGAVKAARMQAAAAKAPSAADYREHITDEDRRYIEESWRHAEGMFPDNPEAALDMAQSTVTSVFHLRGLDDDRVQIEPQELEAASPEELRRKLLQYEHTVSELTGAAPHS